MRIKLFWTENLLFYLFDNVYVYIKSKIDTMHRIKSVSSQ